MDAVRPRILALAPGAQEISVAVEHDDRVLAAVEDINVIPAVDPDRSDLLERPPIRKLRPVFDDAVFEVSGADNDRHFEPSANVPEGHVIEAAAAKQSFKEIAAGGTDRVQRRSGLR